MLSLLWATVAALHQTTSSCSSLGRLGDSVRSSGAWGTWWVSAYYGSYTARYMPYFHSSEDNRASSPAGGLSEC